MTKISPRHQGDEDSLCGPYAVINSLKLLWPDELDNKETQALFRVVIRSLDRWPSIIWEGTYCDDMVVMLNAAQHHLAEKGLPFTWARPFKQGSIKHVEVFETNLRHELDCPGSAVIAMTAHPPYNHWLVVDRLSPHYMHSANPEATPPMRLVSCGLPRKGCKPNPDHKYLFDYPYTFVVRKDA